MRTRIVDENINYFIQCIYMNNICSEYFHCSSIVMIVHNCVLKNDIHKCEKNILCGFSCTELVFRND